MPEIRKEVELDATPEQVWDAVATPAGLTTWFMPMPIDPSGDEVVEWSPGKRLFIEVGGQSFDYVIEARDGAPTVLRFIHGFGEDWSDEFEDTASAGWDMYLATLAAYFRWFAGRPASYHEAEAPESVGWDAVVAAARQLDGEVDYESAQFLGLRTARSLIRFHGRWPIGMPVAVSEHVYDGGGPTADWGSWLAALQP